MPCVAEMLPENRFSSYALATSAFYVLIFSAKDAVSEKVLGKSEQNML